MLPTTAIYLALLTLLFLWLSVNVILTRRSARVSLGTGGNTLLERRIRAHGNCAEYLPTGILILAVVEGLQAPTLVVHVLGGMLLAGRLLHAAALTRIKPQPAMRVVGMALTLASLGSGALLALWSVIAFG